MFATCCVALNLIEHEGLDLWLATRLGDASAEELRPKGPITNIKSLAYRMST